MSKVQKKFYLVKSLAEDIKKQAKVQGLSESVYVQEAMKEKVKKDSKGDNNE